MGGVGVGCWVVVVALRLVVETVEVGGARQHNMALRVVGVGFEQSSMVRIVLLYALRTTCVWIQGS